MNVLSEANLPDDTPGRRDHAPLKLARIRWFIRRLDDRLGLPLTDFGDELVVYPHDPNNRPVVIKSEPPSDEHHCDEEVR